MIIRMKSGLLVPFGLKAGILYEPTQVPNGKACECVCPACNKPLVAKQNAQTPHFAHAQDDNCSKGFETAVHLAAKQIIAKKMQVRLPAVIWNTPIPLQQETKKMGLESTIDLDSVVLEQHIGDITPDIIVTAGDRTYLVEIAVTHFIDDDKQRKLQRKKIPTFEIDVSGLKSVFSMAKLEEAMYSDRNYQAEWKYHPILEKLDLEAHEVERERIVKVRKADEERERLRQERLEKFRKYRSLKPSQQLERNLRTSGMTKSQMNALVKHVPWDNSFGVHREIWQSAVIAFIIKTRASRTWRDDSFPSSVSVTDCLDWLQEAFVSKPKVKNGDRIALWKYFRFLEEKRVLGHINSDDFYILVKRLDWSSLDS